MSVFGGSKKSGNKARMPKSGLAEKQNVFGDTAKAKKPKRPLPPIEEGCKYFDEFNKDRHVYQMFGEARECCTKCGKEHSMITEWRRQIVENAGGIESHPYVARGIWSMMNLQRAMKRKNA